MGLRLQDWIWGNTPSGFKRVSPNRTQMMIVQERLESTLDLEKFRRIGKSEKSPFHGRGKLRVFHLDNGETALVRSYRHGGTFRCLTGNLFWSWPPRPFRELALTEAVRRKGIPTLEIYGAWVERVWGPFYRGWLITRELTEAHDLWAALQSDLYTGTNGRPLLKAVAQSLREMHRRGVYHGDLNLKNILIRREVDGITSYIIDFDKARIFPREVPQQKAQINLSRLLRSVCKLDPDRQRLPQEDWDLFLRLYKEAGAG